MQKDKDSIEKLQQELSSTTDSKYKNKLTAVYIIIEDLANQK
ncbi:hypothetical protein N752_25130 [Desulforamulus aquiferis]|nr:hypothetical protein N752_25130 [Desulforamulus aquiferis]